MRSRCSLAGYFFNQRFPELLSQPHGGIQPFSRILKDDGKQFHPNPAHFLLFLLIQGTAGYDHLTRHSRVLLQQTGQRPGQRRLAASRTLRLPPESPLSSWKKEHGPQRKSGIFHRQTLYIQNFYSELHSYFPHFIFMFLLLCSC